ncbi:MAG TPA: POTRA domain-containing protein [Vicinamibacterales bacterium]|nr:POTRA domain-containing protein [Vicinamibacterales bacterium]
MRRRTVLVLALLFAASAAHAAVSDYVGKPVVEIRLQSNGAELRDPTLLEMIETRTGAPLAMVDVRESMAHLFGLGLYQDVQVDALLRGDGVVLTYNLIPAYRVRRIVFQGALGISENDLRRVVVERHGASPSLARANQAVTTLRVLYRDRGYPRAEIAARTDVSRDPANAALVFTIRPGLRARIGAIDIQGSPRDPAPVVLSALGLQVGDDYDSIALDQRLARYADNLRAQGYYEARASQIPRYVDNDAVVNLALSIDPGPRVEILFQGDALSDADRDRLVPIAREHSVDEDLLEDSKFGIERFFRERGYCVPRADYQRGDPGPPKPGAKADAAGVLRITFTITRGPQCVVQQAGVVGNASIPLAELLPLVLTRTGALFNEAIVGADIARIQSLYRQRGFSSVTVTSQVDRGDVQGGTAPVRVRLDVAEGVRSIIQSVSFQGNAAIDAETLRKAIATVPGQPYFEPQIAADADKLGQLYLNRGYQEIAVRPEPKAIGDGSQVDLQFTLQEGPQVLIDHVLIVGNDRTRRETIVREVQLKSGQPLSQQQEDDTRTRLASLGLFRRVDISYLQLPGERLHRDVVITVEEAPVTTIGYGGGLEGGKRLVRSSETSEAVEEFQIAPRGFFEVSRRNLFGKDRSLNLFTRVSFRPKGVSASPNVPNQSTEGGGYGFNEYLARVTYGERRILGTDADATISAGVEQAVRSSFDFNRRGAAATLTRRVSRTLAVSGRYSLDHTQLLNIKSNLAAQPEIDRLFPQVRLSSVSSSLIRDSRNDSIEPTSGSLIGADAELAARSIGSQVGFFKTFLQGFAYRQLPGSSNIVAVLGARLGLAAGFPRTVIQEGQAATIVVDDLPASERFYAGGDTTVRGFALDRLGTPDTIDPGGFPKGGHGLVVLNAELRIPVRGVLGAVAFVDGGNVFRTVEEMAFGALRAAAGFGLRYRSPVGPIRVDLGFKLDRRILPTGQREKLTALHISLGQAF